MGRSLSIVAGLFLTLMLMAGCVTLTGETAEENYNDATITTAVKSQLAINERVGTLHSIDVKTVKRTVYLSGTAASASEKAKAEQVAHNVKGVEGVVNDITVNP